MGFQIRVRSVAVKRTGVGEPDLFRMFCILAFMVMKEFEFRVLLLLVIDFISNADNLNF